MEKVQAEVCVYVCVCRMKLENARWRRMQVGKGQRL